MKATCTFLFGLLLFFSAQGQTSESTKQADYLISNYQFEKALSLLDALEDSSVSVMQRKAYCYSRLGHVDKAIEYYLFVLKEDSLNRNSLQQLGLLYVKNEDFVLARDCYQRLVNIDSANSFYFRQLANVLAETQEIIGAVMNYMYALQLNPKDVDAYAGLSEILIGTDQFSVADSLLSAGLEQTQSKKIELLLARVKLDQEQYEEVIRHVNHVLQKYDTTTVEARLLGISYYETRDFHKAIECMNFLIAHNVKGDWISYYLGSSYHQLGDTKHSIPALQDAIDQAISENIGVYHLQLAMAFEQSKDYKNAIKYYQAAYEDSKSDILLYHLARNYDEYYEDKAQAIKYFKKYLKSDDTVKLAKEYSKLRLNQLSDYH